MQNLQTLVGIMKDEGYLEEDIVSVSEMLTRVATLKASQQMLELVSSSPEAKELENISDQAEGEKKLQELFEKQTGKNLTDLMSEKIDEAVGDYLAQRNNGLLREKDESSGG